MRARIEIDCSLVSWKPVLQASLRQGSEVDLVNFEFAEHGADCVSLAEGYEVEFRPSRDPSVKAATFRYPER